MPCATGDLPDERIVARVLAGEREAFALLVERYQERLAAYVAGRLPDRSLVDDVLQRTFIASFRRLADYDPDRPLLGWLHGFARNGCREEWRRLRQQAELKHRYLDRLRAERELARLDADVGEDEAAVRALRHCLASLHASEQRLVALRFTEQRPLAEVAAAVARGAEAVRLALFRLRQRLARCVRLRLGGEEAEA